MKLGIKERLRRKYDLGQTWDISPGCMCEGCKAYRRHLKRKRRKARSNGKAE